MTTLDSTFSTKKLDSCAGVVRAGYWERVTYHVQMTSSAVASVRQVSTL